MSMSSFVIRPLIFLSKLFLYGLFVSVFFIFFVLFTSYGQKNAIYLASKWVSSYTQYDIDVDGFKGNLLTHFKINKLDVKYQSIDLLWAEKIDARWHAREILNGKIYFDHIKFGSLFLPPFFKEYLEESSSHTEETSKKQEKIDLNKIFPPIVIDQLSIPVFFEGKSFDLKARLNLPNKNIDLKVIDRKNQKNQWDLSMSSPLEQIYIKVTVNENSPFLLDELHDIDSGYYPLKLNLNSSISQKKRAIKIEIEPSTIEAYQNNFELQGKVDIKDKKSFEINDFFVTNEHGKIKLNGRYADEQVYIDAAVKNFDLPDFQKDAINISAGTLNAKIIANGSIIKPQVKAFILYKTALSNETIEALPITIRLEAETINNQLVAQTEMSSDKMTIMTVDWQSNWSNIQSIQNEKLMANIKVNSELDVLSAIANFDDHKLSGGFSAEIKLENGFDFSGIKGHAKLFNVAYKNKEYGIDVSKTNLEGTFSGIDTAHLKISNANINGGQLQGEGYYTPKYQKFDFLANNISTSILKKIPIDIERGTISAKGHFDGTLEKPDLELSMNVNEFYVDKDVSSNKKFSFESLLSSRNDNTQLTAKLLQSGGELSFMNLNIRNNLYQLIKDSDNAELSGVIKSETNLGVLSKIFVTSQQEIKGVLSTDLIIGGKLNDPKIMGDIILNQGRIEDKKIGILLSNITLRAKAQGSRINIDTLSANDQKNGVMHYKGYIDLSEEPYISLSGNVNNMQLLNSEKYNGMANANLALEGRLYDPVFSGKISWIKLNITLPDSFTSGIPQINYVIKNDDSSIEQKTENKVGLTLNLQVDFPKRVFIRGKGLDVELGGDLLITGSISDPIIAGKLNVIRGNYTFLDKVFDITKGDVGIDGDDIELDLRAEAKAKDLLAIISITGTPDRAKIEISSVPALPEDEIISKLLFGSDSHTLSPLQAIQLANTLSSLSGMQGSGGQLDLLSKTRSFLGIDALSFIGGNVGAGKYLLDNVYIRGEQGTSMDDMRIAIEIEINEHISIESSAGMGSTPNDIKVFWKKDY